MKLAFFFIIFLLLFCTFQRSNCQRQKTLSLWKNAEGDPSSNIRNFNLTSIYLIRNVTQILDNIFLNEDKRLRPTNGNTGEPLVVEIEVAVLGIGPISEHDMKFSIACYFREKYFDTRLKYKAIAGLNELPLNYDSLKNLWKPDSHILNGRKSSIHSITVPNVLLRVRADGRVTISRRLTIEAKCEMFFKKFPMDTNYCHLSIGSLNYYSDEIVYKWSKLEFDKSMTVMLPQYKLIGNFTSQVNISDKRIAGKSRTILKVHFKFQRLQGFYILQIYTPMSMITLISGLGFFIDKTSVAARCSLAIFSILSIITIGFGSRSELPKIGYTTGYDVFVVVNFLFVFSTILIFAIINNCQYAYIRKKIKELEGLKSKKLICQMFASSILSTERASFTVAQDELPLEKEKNKVWWKFWCCKEKEEKTSVFYSMAVKASKAKRTLMTQDPASVVNKIDYLARIIFPSLYIFFLISYFYTYTYSMEDEIDSIIY